MKYFFTTVLLTFSLISSGQNKISAQKKKKNIFKYLEVKAQFGAFMKSDTKLSENGLLDHGYGGIILKMGWQPTNSESWASKYNYPTYGVGFYSGFLSDAQVFGNPNAVYGFIRFPLSHPNRKNEFAIEPALGITYKLNPYDSETNPLNDAIGARMAVYFNLNFGFTYKWTCELDLLYGLDFSHFSNGSTYKPNSGLNLYGINVGLRYNYNRRQLIENKDIYSDHVFPARFQRPERSALDLTSGNAIFIYIGGGLAQTDEMMGTESLKEVLSGVIDYEHSFNEMHGISVGVDAFYDNRITDINTSGKWMAAAHGGYAFSFHKFDIRMQVGTYLGDKKNKGNFFMRPSLRYDINKSFFAQIGLKTLDGGKADYIEYGIGFKPFFW